MTRIEVERLIAGRGLTEEIPSRSELVNLARFAMEAMEGLKQIRVWHARECQCAPCALLAEWEEK